MLTSAWYASMLYECTIWNYLQDGYILLKEAYIANARNNASGTSGDPDKYNSSIQVHIQGKERCGKPSPPPHTRIHTHAVSHTHTHTRTQAPMLIAWNTHYLFLAPMQETK